MNNDLMPDLDDLNKANSDLNSLEKTKIYYYDKNGNVCEKNEAVQYCIVTYDRFGNELSQEWKTVEKGKKKDDSNQSKDSKMKIKAIIALSSVVLIILVVVCNIHVCDDCEEVFFGKGHKITYWGEDMRLCNDCYDF